MTQKYSFLDYREMGSNLIKNNIYMRNVRHPLRLNCIELNMRRQRRLMLLIHFKCKIAFKRSLHRQNGKEKWKMIFWQGSRHMASDQSKSNRTRKKRMVWIGEKNGLVIIMDRRRRQNRTTQASTPSTDSYFIFVVLPSPSAIEREREREIPRHP